jgi:hypothetical protein
MTAVEEAVRFDRRRIELEKKLRSLQAPKGTIPGLSPLLDARRLECAMPNEFFRVQAAFDVCFVHQIRWHPKDTYGDTGIVMTENAKRKDREETPRGVLVSAGLGALDALKSNGIDIGHIVSFIRQAPWRMPVAMVDGVEFPLLILRAGDITGSEDLAAALAAGECEIQWDPEAMQHFYVDKDGKRWTPKTPFLPADY